MQHRRGVGQPEDRLRGLRLQEHADAADGEYVVLPGSYGATPPSDARATAAPRPKAPIAPSCSATAVGVNAVPHSGLDSHADADAAHENAHADADDDASTSTSAASDGKRAGTAGSEGSESNASEGSGGTDGS